MDFEFFVKSFDEALVVLHKKAIVCFTGSDHPLLFFSLLKKNILKTSTINCISISFQTTDFQQVMGQLSMSLFSGACIYWLGNIDECDEKDKKKLLSFIQQYQGPHSVWFFCQPGDAIGVKSNQNSHILPIAQEISSELCQELYTLFFPSVKRVPYFFDALFSNRGNIKSLETVCLLLHYAALLSRPLLHDFMNHWLDSIVEPEKSLFVLSTHFFSKNASAFFRLWLAICHDYPSQFWCSFWSDQLFRATCFSVLASENRFLEAKKIGYGLPFSFIKKDWKLVTAKELIQAHSLVYAIDWRLKNGGSAEIFDLFYGNFFNNQNS